MNPHNTMYDNNMIYPTDIDHYFYLCQQMHEDIADTTFTSWVCNNKGICLIVIGTNRLHTQSL